MRQFGGFNLYVKTYFISIIPTTKIIQTSYKTNASHDSQHSWHSDYPDCYCNVTINLSIDFTEPITRSEGSFHFRTKHVHCRISCANFVSVWYLNILTSRVTCRVLCKSGGLLISRSANVGSVRQLYAWSGLLFCFVCCIVSRSFNDVCFNCYKFLLVGTEPVHTFSICSAEVCSWYQLVFVSTHFKM